jgi:threonine/homoserine/homoserine lactone efflux protein
VAFGFPVMVLAVGLGVDVLFGLHPWIYPTLKVIGLVYLLWMALKIATSSGVISIDEKASKPFTFFQSALFQWVNPKAWMMAITVTSTYTNADKSMFLQVFVIALVYAVVGIGSTHSWALGGTLLTHLLKSKKSVKMFNITMALLIVVSVLPFML